MPSITPYVVKHPKALEYAVAQQARGGEVKLTLISIGQRVSLTWKVAFQSWPTQA